MSQPTTTNSPRETGAVASLRLAKNLYTSNARFVFELLQNADDNEFDIARQQGQIPYVSFRVYPDRVEVDCNEDGFTPENIRAICSVGQSSKSSAQGYIGEKGIGFKSVFMYASKVHIQSGDVSFYFQHLQGESGMGMISPVWQDPEDDLPHPHTRITLFMREFTNPSDLKRMNRTLHQQFQELQSTLLLFLKNIRRIEISIFSEENLQTSHTEFKMISLDGNLVQLGTTSAAALSDKTKAKSNTHIYHCVRHVVTNLEKNDNRSYSETELANKTYSTSEIILAFPLTKSSKPIIESQDLFVFLPVRKVGFNFLVQADFVTQANRQDIVTTSYRNLGLLNGIADAFVQAVLQFCEHDTLQYTWMRYLPTKDYPWEPFWNPVLDRIEQCLKQENIIRSDKEGVLRRIADLRDRPKYLSDQNGNLLFGDLDPGIYLSDKYNDEDVAKLREYGLSHPTMKEILLTVKQDLDAGDGKMFDNRTDQDWHTRAAKLLSRPFTKQWTKSMDEIRRLYIIPLCNGIYERIGGDDDNHNNIYYPSVSSVPIPRDLDEFENLVEPKALENESRKILFDYLGVTTANIKQVRRSIFRKYKYKNPYIDLEDSFDHLRFLYLTQEWATEKENLERIKIHSQSGGSKVYSPCDCYIDNDEPYGPGELLKSGQDQDDGEEGSPSLKVNFVHPRYFEDPPAAKDGMLPWVEWLHTCLGIRRRIKIVSSDMSFSEECSYVANYRPNKFLGMLRDAFEHGDQDPFEDDDFVEQLQATQVLCKSGEKFPLSETYLPIPKLVKRCKGFTDCDSFPFLLLPPFAGDKEDGFLGWSFLDLDREDDIGFRLSILKHIKRENPDPTYLEDSTKLLRLYQLIETACLEASDASEEREEIQEIFNQDSLIFIPKIADEEACWASPSQCILDAPIPFNMAYALQSSYEEAFDEPTFDMSLVFNFFSLTLGVSRIGYLEIIEELENLVESDCDDGDRIHDLYTLLSEIISPEEKDYLRESFETSSLVFIPTTEEPGWHKLSECLWSGATEIYGMVPINLYYDDLEELFVETLGVKTLTLQMVLDELLQMASQAPSIGQVKEKLWVINSFLASGETAPSPSLILEAKVFPVRHPNGKIRLSSVKNPCNFAIMDREMIGVLFRDKVKLLDFSLQEIRRLVFLIQWLSLETRYLSKSVKEVSKVNASPQILVSSPDRDVSAKAYGLLRIAASFNSPRFEADPEGLYETLRSVKVVKTEGISSVLLLSQDGQQHEIEIEKSTLHIREKDNRLTIYIPCDEADQEFCFENKLPEAVADWLMRDPITQISNQSEKIALNTITKVLHCRPSIVSRVLEHDGIVGIDIPKVYEQSANTSNQDEPESETETLVDMDNSSISITRTARVGSRTRRVARASSSFSPRIELSPPVVEDLLADDSFRNLLDNVIRNASRATFPAGGAFDMSDLLDALPDRQVTIESYDGLDASGSITSSSQAERRRKIGAAGELFIFELLSSLELGFDRENWRSTIRRYVTVHPKYFDLEPWNHQETADIVYEDEEGDFTSFLIDKGHLEKSIWQDRTPCVYLEVKTTTGPCNTPFFMSKGQYLKMKDWSNGKRGNKNQNVIYMILRVFNLGKESIGVRIYVDPDALRHNGQLKFTADKWSVVPGNENS
ncbi:hypothetical protein B7463_g6794, partial [Scytalidium lignicola]